MSGINPRTAVLLLWLLQINGFAAIAFGSGFIPPVPDDIGLWVGVLLVPPIFYYDRKHSDRWPTDWDEFRGVQKALVMAIVAVPPFSFVAVPIVYIGLALAQVVGQKLTSAVGGVTSRLFELD